MKTIEEKAKAYDEKIVKAKQQLEGAKVFDYKDGQIAHDIRTTVYGIFPELKESEDERIRKVIYGWICTQPLQFFDNGFSKKEMLAWLEKQGKLVEYYEDRLDRCACENFNKGYKAALEKQGEHKNY